MRRPRPIHSLLSLLVALGLVLTPAMTHTASAAKPASQAKKTTSQKKAARSAAAKKGWETRGQKAKASSNWAARVAANPGLKGNKKAEATFKARSLASQKAAAKRRAPTAAAKQSKKTSKAPKRTVKRTKISKKAKAKNKAKQSRKGAAGAVEDEGDVGDELDELDDGDDFQDVIDNAEFDEGTMAEAEDAFLEGNQHLQGGNEAAAADAFIYGHELMAYEANLAADDYEAQGRQDEADRVRDFASRHTKVASMLRQQYPNAAEAGAAAGEIDDGDEGIDDLDDEEQAPQQPRAQRATGFFGKMKANRAARATFKQMVREDAAMMQEYKTLNSEKRSWKTGFFTGLSAVAFVKSALPIVLTGAITTAGAVFAGLGAFGLASAGVREYKLRDASRKQLVRELHSTGQLSAGEIQTYQAAGWI